MKKIIFILIIFSNLKTNAQWNHVDAPLNYDNYYCSFGDDNTGYVQNGQGQLWKTINQGSHWTLIHPNKLTYQMNFISPDTGFAVNDSCLYKTSNGGITWNSVWTKDSTIAPSLIASPFWFSPDKQIAYCFYLGPHLGSDSIVVLKSTNRGNNWNIISYTSLPVNSAGFTSARIMFVDSLTGFLSNGNAIAKTTDGGITWNIIKQFANGVRNFFACSPDTILSASGGSDTLWRTTDNGITWSAANKPVAFLMYDIWFTSKDTGYVCGGNSWSTGFIAITTDAGANWAYEFTDSHTYEAFSFPSKKFGYVAGLDGTVMRKNLNVGIEESEAYFLPVFPNPTSLYIKLPSVLNVTYDLHDVSGKCVIKNCKEEFMNVIGLEKGIYILTGQLHSKIISNQKIVIQ
jgi:photosystem II stability/assembly factor-like uncharacterized protein